MTSSDYETPQVDVYPYEAFGRGSAPEVHVTFPNEEPDEDERTLRIKFTPEGIIIDGYVAQADVFVGSHAMLYEQVWDRFIA